MIYAIVNPTTTMARYDQKVAELMKTDPEFSPPAFRDSQEACGAWVSALTISRGESYTSVPQRKKNHARAHAAAQWLEGGKCTPMPREDSVDETMNRPKTALNNYCQAHKMRAIYTTEEDMGEWLVVLNLVPVAREENVVLARSCFARHANKKVCEHKVAAAMLEVIKVFESEEGGADAQWTRVEYEDAL